MLRYYVKKSGTIGLKTVATAPSEQAWVYGAGVDDKEIRHLVTHYNLDENIVQDVHDRHELPRVEWSKGNLYVFSRTPRQSHRGNVISIPFLSVLKGSVLITLSKTDYFSPDDVIKELEPTTRSGKHVFVQLLLYVIEQYHEYIHGTGTYIQSTQSRLKTRDVDNKDFVQFVTIESDLNEFLTSLSAIKVVLERLRDNKHDTFTDKDIELIDDGVLYIEQLLVTINSHTLTINSIRKAYSTITSNNLNTRMKTLTLLTLLIALPNVFYGMYGMNVALPFAEQPWAYFLITGFTFVLVLTAFLIVRRLKF